MKTIKTTALAVVALGGLMAFGPMVNAAEETKPATPPAEKKSEAAKPSPEDISKLAEEVGISAEQKSKVDALLKELNEKRRGIRNDTSLTKEAQKDKTKAINEEINGKIKALMTADQFAKWAKLQAARRAARSK